MEMHTATGGLAETNCYLVIDEAARVAAVIDAPKDTTPPLLQICRDRGIEVTHLLLTHGHWDHISDHDVVTRAFPGARVLIHRLDEPLLQRPGSLLWELPYAIAPRDADGSLDDGAIIRIGSIELRVMHTPGHAEGHVCLYHDGGAGNRVLFAGDLIMAGSVGRYDLPGGDIAVLRKSLARVMELPDDTHVLSGHGPKSKIAHERNGNMFLRQWGIGTTG